MTETEADLRRAVLDVERHKERVRNAKQLLLDGKAKLAQEYTATVHRLEHEVRAEENELRRSQVYVIELKDKLERGFES